MISHVVLSHIDDAMMHSLSHGCTTSSLIDRKCTGLSRINIVMPDDAQHWAKKWCLYGIEPYCAIMMSDTHHWAVDAQLHWAILMHDAQPYWGLVHSTELHIDGWWTALRHGHTALRYEYTTLSRNYWCMMQRYWSIMIPDIQHWAILMLNAQHRSQLDTIQLFHNVIM